MPDEKVMATETNASPVPGEAARPVSTVTWEPPAPPGEAAYPVDEEGVAAKAARDSRLASPAQSRAAYVVSRLTKKSVGEVLRLTGVLNEPQALALDAHARDNLIPGYRIDELIGRGAQGVVYRAVQKCLDRVVALKIVSLPGTPSDSVHHRLEREARAIARINHPNIVSAYDYGESRGRLFLAMEFVEGTSCDRELAEGKGWFRKERALSIIREVALGLECACEAGIIHRDVKPGNILLPARGREGGPPSVHAKVTDLGLARMEVSDLTFEGTILGTPGYMAPEQARGEKVDHRADIYSLGATLYHMLTGRRPFGGGEALAVFMRQVSDRLPDPRGFNPDLSAEIVFLLQGMMSRRPETRYGNYRELIADVERVSTCLKPVFPLPPLKDRSIEGPARSVAPATPSSVDMGSQILLLDRSPDALAALLQRTRETWSREGGNGDGTAQDRPPGSFR